MCCCILLLTRCFTHCSTTSSYAGNMMLATVHEWVQAIFPDVPPRLDEGVLDQVYYFRNTFTGATTTVEFRKNEVRMQLLYVCMGVK